MTSMLRSPDTGSTGTVRFAISSRAEYWKLADVEIAGAEVYIVIEKKGDESVGPRRHVTIIIGTSC